MSLRAQINLLLTVLMVLFVAALGAIEVEGARRAIQEELEAASRVTVQLLSNVAERAREQPIDLENMAYFLRHLGRVRANDIRLYDDDGSLVYSSPPSLYKVGRDAPEWFSRLVAPRTAPTVLVMKRGRMEVVPITSRPVLDAWDEFVKVMSLTLALFIVANGLAFWLASRALHPVRHIVRGLRTMGEGDFHARLPRFGMPEMDEISTTFNRMAVQVDETFALRQKARETEFELRQNRELTHLIQHHIEEERRNLARELHDELGQLVTAVKTIAASIVNRSRTVAPELSAGAQTIVDVSSQMYDAMHGMVKRLRPMALDDLGLEDALREYVGQMRQRHPSIEFDLELGAGVGTLSEAFNITTYRIVQECLTNVVRHAQARHARVEVGLHPATERRWLRIEVADDGRGFDVKAVDSGEHFGLLGMRERVQALNGALTISSDGAGVRVEARIPLEPEEETVS